MENFTPVAGLIGGLLIGVAVSLLVLFTGRVAGISGILAGTMEGPLTEMSWRAAFVAGLVLGPIGYVAVSGVPFREDMQASLPWLIAAGLLVGFGTRMGGGCTSGHGVCGLALLSPRSLAATVTFFGVAVVTVFLTRHLLGIDMS